MASKKGSVINVVVCGLTTSSFQGLSGQGAGKSYLCNRFVRPKHDDLKNNTSVLNNSDFGSNIINQDHFLYWGEKTVGLEDGQDVTFQLVEQTEFVDDSTLKPFTYSKPYHKRCTQLKLQSGGKVMYISDDQLALPEEYTNVPKFPDKFHVDGFVLCVDVSCPFDFSNPQREFFNRLLQSVQQSKKPVVVAMTKFDSSLEESVAGVSELVSKAKKQVPLIEVSALKNINVDVCFLVLCHLVDAKKPKTKLVSYPDAKAHLDERVRRIEESFQVLLDREVTDFSCNTYQLCKEIDSKAEYQLLLELRGIDRIHKLVRGQLTYLKKQRVESKLARYMELLPLVLDTLLPQLSLNDNIESCCSAVRSHDKFEQYFVDVKDWRDDVGLLKSDNVDIVPYGVLLEDTGLEVLQNHIDKVLRSLRENAAFDKIQDVLCNAKGILPGTEAGQLWTELNVVEEAELVSGDRLTKLYLEHMSEVERECVAELKELLLERVALFGDQQEDNQKTLDRIDTELKDCPRYKRLDLRPDVRKGQVLKYIGSVQMGSTLGRSHVLLALDKLSKDELLRRDSLRPPTGTSRSVGELQWNLYTDPQEYFNMALMARTLDNVITFRSDFMNHLSGSSMFETGGVSYRVEMSLFHSDEAPIDSMANDQFVPDGAVAVVNSTACLDWLEDLLTRLWIPPDPAHSTRDHTPSTTQPPYRGMPLVILALDRPTGDEDTPLHKRAKALASMVQATCLTERPTDQPKRLVVSGVVIQLLSALMDVALPTVSFFTTPLPAKDHQGLNVAVCTVTDDPYPSHDLLSPWLRHQAVCCEDGRLFVRSSLDKQLRTCTLTFHSALNLKDILSFTRLGFILVYFTTRPASLSVIKHLLSRLPQVPKMVIAIVSDQSCDSHMIKEGRDLAETSGATFVSTVDPEWTIGCTSEFFSRCWFVRFTSWSCQRMPEDVVSRQREKRQARALPTRPSLLDHDRSLPPARERHSIGAFLEEDSPPGTPPFPSGTIPRSPARDKYRKPHSLPSPPPVHDSNIYSDPIASKIGIKQMKAATLERKKSSTTDPLSPPPMILTGDLPDNAFMEGPESDYASVEDALQSSGGLPLSLVSTLERQRRGLKSPSMSPPPVPLSPTDTEISVLDGGSSDEEDLNDLYATVQKTNKKSSKAKSNGYDHLEKSPEIPRRTGYDKLDPPPIPKRTDSLSGSTHQAMPPQQTTPTEEMYATVDLSAKTSRQRPAHRMTHNRHKSADTTLEGGGGLYSVVKKPPPTKPRPPRRAATPEEPVYSLPEKKVKGHITPPPGTKTPPPVAPKPGKRTPTPTGPGRAPGLASVRSESFDTGMRSKFPLLPDFKIGRSFSMEKRPLKSPVVSGKDTTLIDMSSHTGSLPRNYHNRVTESRVMGNGHAFTRSLDLFEPSDDGDTPTIPERNYLASELELEDEPPPLPPRLYSWSDVEDNDDELFQSEDELEDSNNRWTVSDQQKLYATITRVTQERPDSVSGVEAIYKVVNKMVLIDDDESSVQVARQSSMTQEEESAYDTLENVIKSIRGETHTPFSPSPTARERRGVVTPEPVKPATPTESKATPTPAAAVKNEQPGLKSTPLTAAEIKNLQKTQKLLKRLEKQAKKEATRRQASEAKKRKREEEEQRKKEGRKKTKKGKSKQPERSRYFGSPLDKVADEGGVPVFVRKCVEFIEREGLTSEGIYRVPGKKESVLLLQDQFEEDQTLDLASLNMYETAVSSTLKAYFKVLPDPLISESVAAQLLVVNSLDQDSQKTRIHELLSSLPRPNLKTLKFMMNHLHEVQKQNEVNKMTPSNLSIVFWPTLMRPPLMDLADPSKQLGWQLIMTRIIERPDFVPDVD